MKLFDWWKQRKGGVKPKDVEEANCNEKPKENVKSNCDNEPKGDTALKSDEKPRGITLEEFNFRFDELNAEIDNRYVKKVKEGEVFIDLKSGDRFSDLYYRASDTGVYRFWQDQGRWTEHTVHTDSFEEALLYVLNSVSMHARHLNHHNEIRPKSTPTFYYRPRSAEPENKEAKK